MIVMPTIEHAMPHNFEMIEMVTRIKKDADYIHSYRRS